MNDTAFIYVHCDVPPSMTLDEWRARNCSRRPNRRAALVTHLRRCICGR